MSADWAGWVMLHRRLLYHPIWVGERFTRGQAWADLILTASHEGHLAVQGLRPVTVRRGQVLTSQVRLANRWRWNRETVRAYLDLLKSLGMIDFRTSKATDTGYTLITILNYDTYQGDREQAADFPSSNGHVIQPGSASSIDPASTQHRPSTIKKGKKGKNGKKKESAEAAPAGSPEPAWGSPDALIALYNRMAPAELPRVTRSSDGRRRKAQAYLQQFPDLQFWVTVFGELGSSALLRGLKPSPGHEHFRADFDWLLAKGKDGSENCLKVFEGKYRDAGRVDQPEPEHDIERGQEVILR